MNEQVPIQSKAEPLISCQTLAKCLERKEQINIFDCSWELPSAGKKALAFTNWQQERIPSSTFLDIELDLQNGEFQRFLTHCGIKSVDEQIVLYDSIGMWSVAKGYWMFLMFGFKNVNIVSGGLPEWKKFGLPIERGAKIQIQGEAKEDKNSLQENFSIVNKQFLSEFKDINAGKIVDLRSSDRFNGIPGSEPRAAIPSGHIPGSVNIPFSTFRTENGQFLLPTPELERLFVKNLGTNWKEQNLIFSCGSGVTTCIGFLATQMLEKDSEVSVYSGSWTDYCQRIQ